jgi:hypothetical protein
MHFKGWPFDCQWAYFKTFMVRGINSMETIPWKWKFKKPIPIVVLSTLAGTAQLTSLLTPLKIGGGGEVEWRRMEKEASILSSSGDLGTIGIKGRVQ